MGNEINVIEHLLRLHTMLKISNFVFNDSYSQQFLKELEQITNDVIRNYQITRDHLISFNVKECIGLKEKLPVLAIMEASAKYVEENSKGLNEYCISKLINAMNNYIYKLKFA